MKPTFAFALLSFLLCSCAGLDVLVTNARCANCDKTQTLAYVPLEFDVESRVTTGVPPKVTAECTGVPCDSEVELVGQMTDRVGPRFKLRVFPLDAGRLSVRVRILSADYSFGPFDVVGPSSLELRCETASPNRASRACDGKVYDDERVRVDAIALLDGKRVPASRARVEIDQNPSVRGGRDETWSCETRAAANEAEFLSCTGPTLAVGPHEIRARLGRLEASVHFEAVKAPR